MNLQSLILSSEERKNLAAKWNKQELPQQIFDSYLVYVLEGLNIPFLVGHSKDLADSVEKSFIERKLQYLRIDGEYPFEIFKYWKENKK